MDFTGKQERNGATGSTDAHNTAVPGPDASGEIAALIGQAQSVAVSRLEETIAEFAAPAGSGVAGHSVGANGDMFSWDSGLAVSEPSGEAG